WNRQKSLRHQVTVEALGAIAALPGVRVGAVVRQTTARRAAYAREQHEVYALLVEHLTRRLTAAEDFGTIVIDGNASDLSYQQHHRGLKLATRRIIEDPCFQAAHRSQLVQIA